MWLVGLDFPVGSRHALLPLDVKILRKSTVTAPSYLPKPADGQPQGVRRVEWGSGAAAVGRACLFPPLSSGGALAARPWLRFHFPLIEPDMRISLHPALGQDPTPSPTARRAQAGSDARARRSRRGAGVDSCRPCFVWFCA